MTNAEPKNIPPPEGYASWLDYAVENLDTRTLVIQSLFDDAPGPTRDQYLAVARRELQELRKKQKANPDEVGPNA